VYLKGLLGSELGDGEARQGSLGFSDSCQLQEAEGQREHDVQEGGNSRDEEGIIERVDNRTFDVNHHLRARAAVSSVRRELE